MLTVVLKWTLGAALSAVIVLSVFIIKHAIPEII